MTRLPSSDHGRTWRRSLRSLLFAACGIFGLFFVVAGTMSISERYETESWPAREAVITHSKATWSTTASRPTKSWYPLIKAAYVDGGEEVTVRVAYGRWLGWGDEIRRNAEADVARYPVGRTVTVYHAPAQPQRAILERLPWRQRLDLIATGLALLAVPVLSWRLGRARIRGRRSP
jgi:hypothetical protein